MCWNKGRLCWKTAKLFYFCHLKKLVRPETFGLYYVSVEETQSLKNLVYLVGLHIHYKMIHGPYSVKWRWLQTAVDSSDRCSHKVRSPVLKTLGRGVTIPGKQSTEWWRNISLSCSRTFDDLWSWQPTTGSYFKPRKLIFTTRPVLI